MNPNEDPELEAIRQKRMQELASRRGMSTAEGDGGLNATQMQQEEEAKREVMERRQALLMQVLDPEAKERLSRISLVKPEKARQIEDMILAQATSGRLAEKVSEKMLIQILEEAKERSGSSGKVTFQRRKNILDDDDDDDLK